MLRQFVRHASNKTTNSIIKNSLPRQANRNPVNFTNSVDSRPSSYDYPLLSFFLGAASVAINEACGRPVQKAWKSLTARPA